MEDIEAKKKAGRPLRHGRNSLRLTLRELGINERKDEDALFTPEIAAEIQAEKIARSAEGVVARAASSQGALSPEDSTRTDDAPEGEKLNLGGNDD